MGWAWLLTALAAAMLVVILVLVVQQRGQRRRGEAQRGTRLRVGLQIAAPVLIIVATILIRLPH